MSRPPHPPNPPKKPGGKTRGGPGAGVPSRDGASPENVETVPEVTDAHRSPIALIRDIQSGKLSATSISAEDRRRCVEHLTTEGLVVAEIADVLRVNERTIHRDRSLIRQANALQVHPGFAGEMAGALVRQAEQGVARLRRISRDRETPPAVRVDAERAAWVISAEVVQVLQKLGYLPTTPQAITAEVTCRSEEPGSYDELFTEVERLQAVVATASSGGADATANPALAKLNALLDLVQRGQIREQLQLIAPPTPPSHTSNPNTPPKAQDKEVCGHDDTHTIEQPDSEGSK